MRVPLLLPVKLKKENSDEFENTSIQDISWGGVLINPNPLPAVGARLLLELDIPDQSVMLEIWGTVVRVNNDDKGNANGVGVEFDELDHETRSQIQTLVQNLVSAQFRKK